MALGSIPLLVAAAFAGGTMNAVAGGGTFVTFPALIFAGVPAIAANATSSAALFPGTAASVYAQREDLARLRELSLLRMAVISLIGGAAGAVLLLLTPESTFSALVPWLLLVATGLFAAGPWLSRRLHGRRALGPSGIAIVQLLIAVYGGYFGGAIGILMLAALQLYGLTDIAAMTGFKNVLATVMNATAVVCFVVAGRVLWLPALVMVAGAVAGGYLGARVARRMKPSHVRAIIIAIGLLVSAGTFFK